MADLDGKEQADLLYGDSDGNVRTLDPIRSEISDDNGKALEIEVTIRYREGSSPTVADLRNIMTDIMSKISLAFKGIFMRKPESNDNES